MGTPVPADQGSPVADAVKRAYLASDVTGTVVTARADGVPHRLLRTPLTDQLERAGDQRTVARARGLPRPARAGQGSSAWY